MATITWRRGERRTEFIAAETDDGTSPDLSTASATISISAAAACHVVPLTLAVDGSGFEWRLSNDTMPDLPPRAYRATLTITRGDDDTLTDMVLNIEGGC